jgi:hypothetical protein
MVTVGKAMKPLQLYGCGVLLDAFPLKTIKITLIIIIGTHKTLQLIIHKGSSLRAYSAFPLGFLETVNKGSLVISSTKESFTNQ